MNNKLFYSGIAILLTASIAFWAYMFQDSPSPEITEHFEGEITLTMYHGEGCACCLKWADYLEKNGVTVIEELVDDPYQIKREKGVPTRLSSCHTAVVDGYVVEGHVPVEDIRRLLAERPDAIGISAPGMPPSAPGMDAPFSREYQVVIFDESEKMYVYSTHN